MTHKKYTPQYSAEFRARGIRLYQEHRADYCSDNAAYCAIGGKLGCSPDSPRNWCQQAERDAGKRSGLTSDEKARLKQLEHRTEKWIPVFGKIRCFNKELEQNVRFRHSTRHK